MKVLELFSGIGGMHFSLKEAGVSVNVIAAVDINTSANEVYRQNFPTTSVYQRNIQSFSADEINNLNPDMITMSPPCQPFTRLGLKKDSLDDRSNALIYIIKLLPKLNNTLRYIFLENVKGFEDSETRNMLIEVLQACDFEFQEFLLNPIDYCIPNSRLRYYLIAKRKPEKFPYKHDSVMNRIPLPHENITSLQNAKFAKSEEMDSQRNQELVTGSLSQMIETAVDMEVYKIPKKVLLRYGSLFDITFPFSRRSCCFTRAYGRYAEGTGSVLCPEYVEEAASVILNKIKSLQQLEKDREKENAELAVFLEELGLRYFSPREIARLMCFPESFTWPEHFTPQQMYKLLGNSINVHIVTLLLILLINGENS